MATYGANFLNLLDCTNKDITDQVMNVEPGSVIIFIVGILFVVGSISTLYSILKEE